MTIPLNELVLRLQSQGVSGNTDAEQAADFIVSVMRELQTRCGESMGLVELAHAKRREAGLPAEFGTEWTRAAALGDFGEWIMDRHDPLRTIVADNGVLA